MPLEVNKLIVYRQDSNIWLPAESFQLCYCKSKLTLWDFYQEVFFLWLFHSQQMNVNSICTGTEEMVTPPLLPPGVRQSETVQRYDLVWQKLSNKWCMFCNVFAIFSKTLIILLNIWTVVQRQTSHWTIWQNTVSTVANMNDQVWPLDSCTLSK